MKNKYSEECRIIRQNCTYSAQAHHLMAASAKKKALWVETIPAASAAISSTLVACQIVGTWLLPFTVLSAAAAAIAAVINPNKQYQEHLSAAKGFTSLKHDARFLGETASLRMTDDAFAVAVENLHQKYNEFLKGVPPTSADSFAKARMVVQGDIHEPDRDEHGNVR